MTDHPGQPEQTNLPARRPLPAELRMLRRGATAFAVAAVLGALFYFLNPVPGLRSAALVVWIGCLLAGGFLIFMAWKHPHYRSARTRHR